MGRWGGLFSFTGVHPLMSLIDGPKPLLKTFPIFLVFTLRGSWEGFCFLPWTSLICQDSAMLIAPLWPGAADVNSYISVRGISVREKTEVQTCIYVASLKPILQAMVEGLFQHDDTVSTYHYAIV